jgi:hypothetical protein
VLYGSLDPPEPVGPDEGRRPAAVRRRGAAMDAGWRVARQVCRTVVPVCVVAVALVGALLAPRLTVTVGPSLAVFAGGLVALLHPEFPAQATARRAAVLSAAGGAVAAPFIAGVTALGAPGALLAMVLLVLISFLAANWITEDGPERRITAGDLSRLRHAAPALSIAALVEQWLATDRVLGRRTTADVRATAIEMRALLLDEFVRRDPSGVDAWLRHPGSRPDEHIRGDQEAEK